MSEGPILLSENGNEVGKVKSGQKESNQFDRVAPMYDFLSNLVFGNSIYRAQTFHLNATRKDDRVLVVGGGTGKILRHPAFQRAGSIDYVELSGGMIERAKRNGVPLTNINFIQQDFFDHEGKYDFIICNFFLDCFDEKNLKLALEQMNSLLAPAGQIIVTDFRHTGRAKSEWLIKFMLLFFRSFARLQSKELLNIDLALQQTFSIKEQQFFNKGLVFTFLCRPIVQST